MTPLNRHPLKLSVLWGCGYAFIVSQWLVNGSLGSSWLPELSNFDLALTIGQISLWAAYLVFLAALWFAEKRITMPLAQKRTLLLVGIVGIMVGDCLVFTAGSGLLSPVAYVCGMLLVGAGNSVLMSGWGEYYCAVGEKKTCLVLSLSFIIGSLLFLLISFIGQISLFASMVSQLVLMPLCPLFLVQAWRHLGTSQATGMRSAGQPPAQPAAKTATQPTAKTATQPAAKTAVQSPAQHHSDRPEFPLRSLVPFFVTILLFGLVLGIVTGLSSTQEVQTSPFVWAIGMCLMGALLLVAPLSIREFTLDKLSRIVIPLLAISLMLVPALVHRSFDIVSIFLCSGYVYARVFYTIAYVSIAQTHTVPVLRLVTSAIAVDTLGVIIGQVVCGITLRDIVSTETTYIIAVVSIALLVITATYSLREKSIASLWGLRDRNSSDSLIEKRCMELALKYNLTLRETDIAARLAKGLTVEIIAPELGVSVATIRTHMRNIYAKIDVHSQPELMRMVIFNNEND